MVDWWTDEDRSEFGKRTKALIEQYNEFEPKELPGHHVHGEFTIGENIGDLGRLSIAIAAYQIAPRGHAPPVIDGLTGLPRRFCGLARIGRAAGRERGLA